MQKTLPNIQKALSAILLAVFLFITAAAYAVGPVIATSGTFRNTISASRIEVSGSGIISVTGAGGTVTATNVYASKVSGSTVTAGQINATNISGTVIQGTSFIGSASGLTGLSSNQLHTQIISNTGAGNFTTTSAVSTSTVFEFFITGPGNAGSNFSSPGTANWGGGGGAGGTCYKKVSGLSPSTSYPIYVGAANGASSTLNIGGTLYAGNGGAAAAGNVGGNGGTGTSNCDYIFTGGVGQSGPNTSGIVNVNGTMMGGSSIWGSYSAPGAGGIGGNSTNGVSGLIYVKWLE